MCAEGGVSLLFASVRGAPTGAGPLRRERHRRRAARVEVVARVQSVEQGR